jgi:hypothetical protein
MKNHATRRFNPKSADRIENQLSDVERKIDQCTGKLERFEEGSYEYGMVRREIAKLVRKQTQLTIELEEIMVVM